MFLDQMASIGAFVGKEEFIKTEFEWSPEEGVDPVKFEISVKKEITVADWEFIQFGELNQDNQSLMARRVSKLVRIHAINGVSVPNEQMSIEDAKRLKPSLLMAFVFALNKTEAKQVKPAEKKPLAKKQSPRLKSSGVS